MDEDDALLLGHLGSGLEDVGESIDEDDELLLGKSGSGPDREVKEVSSGAITGAFAGAYAAALDETGDQAGSTDDDLLSSDETAQVNPEIALSLDEDASPEEELDRTVSLGEVESPIPDDQSDSTDEDDFLRELEDLLS